MSVALFFMNSKNIHGVSRGADALLFLLAVAHEVVVEVGAIGDEDRRHRASHQHPVGVRHQPLPFPP